MKTILQLFLSVFILKGFNCEAQCGSFNISFLNSDPSSCRISSFQTPDGVVQVMVSGGTSPYIYLWTNIQTGATSNNTIWGSVPPGSYKIEITDNIGCVLIDTVEVDSINPIADFTVSSVDLDLSLTGNAPVNITVHNNSLNYGDLTDPWYVPTFYWKVGNTASYVLSTNYTETFSETFNYQGTQEICLVATNQNVCDDTLCKIVTIIGQTGIHEDQSAFAISLFPNPSSQNLQIKSDENIDLITIYSMNGKLVYVEELLGASNEYVIDISLFDKGVYILQIENGQQITIQEFVKY